MWKEKVRIIRDFIVKNSKFVFPVIIIAAVAATVTIALNAGDADSDKQIAEESSVSTETSVEQVEEHVEKDVALVANEDDAIAALVVNYYNAVAMGDSEMLNIVCDEISDKDMLRYVETSKYIGYYPVLETYTKPGPEEGSTIAYVYYKVVFENRDEEVPGYQAFYICTDESGNLYMKRGENSDEVNQYIMDVSTQDDVVEFNNRINVEYNELVEAKPELLAYLIELDSQVSTAVGEGLAKLAASEETQPEANGENADASGEDAQQPAEDETTEPAAEENVVLYATATTTVNVRSSDSEQADKLGKATEGSKLQVIEQRANGWTKVLYEGKEGYIKSEYLQMVESAAGAAVIGTVTATTNINVRAAASETADRLGVLAGGDSADLLANENGWCKIKYNGQIGYVKAEYVEQ